MKKQVEIGLCLGGDAKKCAKALKTAVGFPDVTKASFNGDKSKLTVEGEGLDAVKLAKMLRKKMGYANLVTVKDADEKKEDPKKKDEKKDEHTPMVVVKPSNWCECYPPYYYYPAEPCDSYQHSCTIL